MLAHLRAAFNWAVKMGMLPKAPTIERPRRAKGAKMMKGRSITLEEFERMLDKVVAVVGDVAAPSWQHYLRGLWTSGLRLGESLDLHWDRPDKLRVDMDGKRPMLHIPAELEKGNKDRLLPMAPEFAEFLAAVPPEERTGPVFKPLTRRGKRPSKWWASRTVCAVGKKTVVKVDQRTKGNKLVVKYASAHDLRRSFGERWASRVMPQVLMELMRHESIETTLKFYVGRNAETTADVLWAAHKLANGPGNTSGNSVQKEAQQHSEQADINPSKSNTSKVDRGGIEPPTHGFSDRTGTAHCCPPRLFLGELTSILSAVSAHV
jgi:integrase